MADSDSSRAGSNPFLDAPMHVLVFTSAGKPIFSYVEDEDEGFAPLCGVLLVLMSMPSQLPQQSVVSDTTTTTTEDLQYIVFGGSSYGIYFHQRGELRYVYATRQSAGGPANAARGLELLRMVEHFVCAVAPTMNTVLQRAPNYDARSLFSPADFCVLRTLIAHHVQRIEAAVDAVAVAPIAADVRRRLQHLLQQHYRVGEGHTHMESHLYTFVLSSSGLLAMMGPQQSYDQHRRTPDATVVESSGEPEMMHMCGSLSMRDVRLLQHMAMELQRRQPGEAWIPLCLADFCPASFLWCYCCNLGAHARQSSASLEDGDACRRSPSPSSYTSTSSIMLLQIATDAADFPTLSAHAGEMAAALVHDGSSNSAGSLLQQLEEGGAAHTSLIRASSADVDGDAWRWIVSTSDSSTPNTLPLPLRWVGVVFTTNAAAGRRGLRGHLRSSTTMPSEPAIAQRIALLLRVMSSSSELVLDEDDAWSIAMQRIGPCADATSTTLIAVFLPATPREEMLGFLQQAAAGWPCFVTEYAALQEWCCA